MDVSACVCPISHLTFEIHYEATASSAASTAAIRPQCITMPNHHNQLQSDNVRREMVQRLSSRAPLSGERDTTHAISAPLTAALPRRAHRSMGLGHVHGWWFCGVFCLSITQLKFRLFACAISDNGLSLAGCMMELLIVSSSVSSA